MELTENNRYKLQVMSDTSSPPCVDSPDRPLSPVLSAGKIGRHLNFRSRQNKSKSRKNLSNKFASNTCRYENKYFLENETRTDNRVQCKNGRVNKLGANLEALKTAAPEECLKLAEEIKSKREEFYTYFHNLNVNAVETEASGAQFEFKKPQSPVPTRLKRVSNIPLKIVTKKDVNVVKKKDNFNVVQEDLDASKFVNHTKINCPFKDIDINIVISKGGAGKPLNIPVDVQTNVTEDNIGELNFDGSPTTKNSIKISRSCTSQTDNELKLSSVKLLPNNHAESIQEFNSEITDSQINFLVDNLECIIDLNKTYNSISSEEICPLKTGAKNSTDLIAPDTSEYFNRNYSLDEDKDDDTVSDKKCTSAFRTLDCLNSQCKNILSVIHLVEKRSNLCPDSLKSDEDCDEFVERTKFALNKSNDIYFFGFTKEEQTLSKERAERSETSFETWNSLVPACNVTQNQRSKMKKSIFSISNDNTSEFKRRNIFSACSQTSVSNVGDSLCGIAFLQERDTRDDGVITLYKSKKRVPTEFSLPPSKRHKPARIAGKTVAENEDKHKQRVYQENPSRRSDGFAGELNPTKAVGGAREEENEARSSAGFQTALGNKITVSKEALKKAEKMYKDASEDVQTTPKETSKTNKTSLIPKPTDKDHKSTKNKTSIVQDAATETNQKTERSTCTVDDENSSCETEKKPTEPTETLKILKEATVATDSEIFRFRNKDEWTSTLDLDTRPRQTASVGSDKSIFKSTGVNSGFVKASGAKVSVSDLALRNAKNMYNEVVAETKASTRFEREKSGFNCNKATEVSENNEKIKKQPTNENVMQGFKCASGKGLVISEKALKSAEKFFEELDTATETTSTTKCEKFTTMNSKFGFKSVTRSIPTPLKSVNNKPKESGDGLRRDKQTPKSKLLSMSSFRYEIVSGSKLPVSEAALETIHRASQETLTTENTGISTLSEIEEETATKLDNMSEGTTDSYDWKLQKKIESTDSKTKTISCTSMEVVRNDSKQRPTKTLGAHVRRQLEIPKFKVQEAMLIFEDILEDQKVEKTGKTTAPPGKPANVGVSSPVPGPREQHIVLNNAVRMSPMKIQARNDSKNDSNMPISINGETKGSPEEWLFNVENECEHLQRKLDVLTLKRKALEQQTKLLQKQTTERQMPGRMYVMKSTKSRVTLRQWVKNSKPGDDCNMEINERILNLTPQNAEYVHFNVNSNDGPKSTSSVKTEDGAIIIPNNNNSIGISEIESAFMSMPGVVRSFLPRGWIRNHYKWIVWKLASMERSYPRYFRDTLNIQNVMLQLKYRYDREIDRAERSAVRRILEKDDASQKRMILCVSHIIRLPNAAFELELTDGWYSVRTLIDVPLCEAIKNSKIVVGTKLIVHNAKLLNCEGCYPLQTPDFVRLKIAYNCTRRAAWDAKLGFQSYPGPLPILITSVHPKGGVIGCLKVYVARVYPLRFMEKHEGAVSIAVWRNEKAERKRAVKWENERCTKIEKLQERIQEEFGSKTQVPMNVRCGNLSAKEVSLITCPKTLHYLMKNTKDPEKIREMLSESQHIALIEYAQKEQDKYQQNLSTKLSEAVEKSGLMKRNVSAILKLTVMDAREYSEKGVTFNIWNPTTEHLEAIKEGRTFSIYNAVPKSNGSLAADSRTQFKLETGPQVKYEKTHRQILPIAMTLQTFCKPFFHEFDTVGIVVKAEVGPTNQNLWLTDVLFRLLLINVSTGPDYCLLFDDLRRGQIVVACNLILCEPKNAYGFALANQHSVVTRNPQNPILHAGLESFLKDLPQDLDPLLDECDKKISFYMTSFKRVQNEIAVCLDQMLNEPGEDDASELPSHLTAIDVAMSMIDTDQL